MSISGSLINKIMASAPAARRLSEVVELLDAWLKPKVLGEGWDNIGLLLGSGKSSRMEDKLISDIMVCNDFTPDVLGEAVEKRVGLVVAYHPVIFQGMKRIGFDTWKERLIARCLSEDISIYSPHTTLDTIPGGINDKVVEALEPFGSLDAPLKSQAITPSSFLPNCKSTLSYSGKFGNVSNFIQDVHLSKFKDFGIEIDADENNDTARIAFHCDADGMMLENVGVLTTMHSLTPRIPPKPAAVFGAGRIVRFKEPVDFSKVVDAVKKGLNLDYIQVAGPQGKVKSAAICVGSGSSLLKGVDADVFITGEMSHHDILDAAFNGTSLILCNHCSSERHYLPKLAGIVKLLTKVPNVFVSKMDKSPLSLA